MATGGRPVHPCSSPLKQWRSGQCLSTRVPSGRASSLGPRHALRPRGPLHAFPRQDRRPSPPCRQPAGTTAGRGDPPCRVQGQPAPGRRPPRGGPHSRPQRSLAAATSLPPATRAAAPPLRAAVRWAGEPGGRAGPRTAADSPAPCFQALVARRGPTAASRCLAGRGGSGLSESVPRDGVRPSPTPTSALAPRPPSLCEKAARWGVRARRTLLAAATSPPSPADGGRRHPIQTRARPAGPRARIEGMAFVGRHAAAPPPRTCLVVEGSPRQRPDRPAAAGRASAGGDPRDSPARCPRPPEAGSLGGLLRPLRRPRMVGRVTAAATPASRRRAADAP